MTRDQAEEVQRHLLDAADAIDRADQIIFNLDHEDRKRLAGPLGATVCALHFELLKAVYDEHPELRPPDETPVISSFLRWDDALLPPSVSEADLDAIIFSVMTSHFRKTAMIIGLAFEKCREWPVPISDEILSARIGALSESDRIDSVGDVRKWRHSEVRLKS